MNSTSNTKSIPHRQQWLNLHTTSNAPTNTYKNLIYQAYLKYSNTKSYKLRNHLPLNGQRTRTNAKTARRYNGRS